jgi:hypothetical protein
MIGVLGLVPEIGDNEPDPSPFPADILEDSQRLPKKIVNTSGVSVTHDDSRAPPT